MSRSTTTTNPQGSESDFETTVEADRVYVVQHVVNKMVQAGALLTPPAYAVIMLARRRPLSISGLFRATSRSTFGVFAPLGFLMGTARLWNEPGYAIQDRAFRLRESASQPRADQFAGIGFLAGASVLSFTPARFGSLLTRFTAGGAMGAAAGILTHVATLAKEEGVEVVKKEVEASLPVKAIEGVTNS